MTEEFDNRDPLLASMTRRYLEAQNKVAQRQALLVKTRDLLLRLKEVAGPEFDRRMDLLDEIEKVLE